MNRPLPHDGALPQLAQALDPVAMAGVFAPSLGGLRIVGCEVDRVKYRPQRNCSVAYRLTLCDTLGNPSFEQRVAARFYSDGDTERRFRAASQHPQVSSPAGPTTTHSSALDMLAYWLPNDAKLSTLQLLHNQDAIRQQCLEPVVAALTDGQGRLVDHEMQLAQVVPERRVCARVALRLQKEWGAGVSTQVVYAKADIDQVGATTHAVMQALSASPMQQQGKLHTAQSLLWQPSVGIHWQLGVKGAPLPTVDPMIGVAQSARVGARLAALHATATPASRRIEPQALQKQVQDTVALLAKVEPSWQPRLTRLTRCLETGMASLAHEPWVTLHGDLHPNNVLAGDTQLTFIDFDSVRVGPAVLELGAWIGDALYRAVINKATPQSGAPAWRAFLAAYVRASGRTPDPSLLAWSAAHHLLCKRAHRCVSNLKPGRFESVPQLLSLAEAIALARGFGGLPMPDKEAA